MDNIVRGEIYEVKRSHVDQGTKHFQLRGTNLGWFPEDCFIKLNPKVKLFRLFL